MKINYQKNKLKKQLSSASEIKKYFGINAKRIVARLDDMEASPNLAILIQIPAANCHQLSGTRVGQWAVDVSANYRLIFVVDHEPIPLKKDKSLDTSLVTIISILEIADYH